ncbi:Cytosol aminopeptidase [Enhygromyxa salina]|uniref:Cytosol aminopeptidase n=1 Tax=Enhygromyxa salina TaxID=215803 RepID=A0A2S9XJX5_9BACT|nr:leucyl aminopeptidase family protein [Enhygromyxa salina]PRP93137.1 Cytosol aminopeptidase [Enhygromyxa salina]
MSSIGFASSTKTLLKGAKTIAVVGAAAVFNKRRFPKLLGKKLDALTVELAKTVEAGDLGASATTLTGGEPAKLGVGVLPDSVSRYNAASRAECVRRAMGGLAAGKGKLAIILVVDDPSHILAQAIAIGRCFPQFSGKSKAKSRRVQLLAVDRKGAVIKPESGVTGTVAAVRDSAELVDTPPSELHPEAFANRARELLEGTDVEIEEIVGDELAERGLGGIHAVGRAALSAPRLFVASYTPAGSSEDAEDQRHVALVGKGVTYDTGGLHLKPRGGMEGMKCDMGGAAATLGAFRVLVAARCRHRVSLVLCMAENAIGPASYKPDDILTMHSGKTVEINNTDAEGRLLLADGVSFAARELEADTIFDAATLTGAQMISTGVVHGAVVTNDAELEQTMIAAGHHSGDLLHPLPFAPELYKQEFSSQVADMCNSVRNRMNAQSACAAQFVYNHLDGADVRWGHVDLAGPAFRKDRATGFGVAVLAATVLNLS